MATGDGRPFFADGFHAAGFFDPTFFGETTPTPSTDPFGDVRHSAFGDRVRRSSSWLTIFLSLWVGY